MQDDRPWLTHYAPGVPADATIPDGSVVDIFAGAARQQPDRIALDFLGATSTYAEVWHQIRCAANALHNHGVAAGDRVAIALPNCPQHVVAFYAVLRLGAIVVEHNPLYTQAELGHQFADHQPKLVIAWDAIASQAQAVSGGAEVIAVDMTRALPLAKRIMLRLPIAKARDARQTMTRPAPGLTTWHSLLAGATPIDDSVAGPGANDIALLQYTGGTTGVPKGAILTHRNLVANAAQSAAWVPVLKPAQETFYAVLPMFHAYGLTLSLTTAVLLRETVVLFPKFDPEMVLEAMKRRPCTFLPGVPPMYPRLVEAADRHNVDLRSIKVALAGAMALPPDTVEMWESRTGGLLVEGYGMTESSPISVGNPVAPTRRPGAIGIPFPSTRVRVVDPANPHVLVPQGQPGELLVQGPQVFAGYWNRGEETAATLLPEGWLRTGDIVVQDEDGYLRLVDRIKEIVLVGGFNVYPSEVERAIAGLPGVADVAVTALRDGDHDIVAAAVVALPDVALDPEALRAACREVLAGYKVPKRIVLVDSLPRSVVGKVLRKQVRDMLETGANTPID
jgi:long-chain acyl-CoA synthetase